MTESAEQFIKRKTEQFQTKNSLIPMKDIGRKGKFFFKREAWTFLPQNSLDKKVFVLERLKKVRHEGELAYGETWKDDVVEYRIGYFIVGRIGRAKGRWVWGQYCPLIPSKDLVILLKKGVDEEVILKEDWGTVFQTKS